MDEQPENDLLHSYLNETLPTLGLDSETYAPYVMGCLANSEEEARGLNNEDEENLNEIIELLRASSETHSDDDDVWDKLKSQVINYHKDYLNQKRDKKNAELLELRKVEEAKRQKEIEAAIQAQREMESHKFESKEMSAAKKALLEQYAYDTSELYDNNGNLIEDGGGSTSKGGKGKNNKQDEEEEELSNREAAKKASIEKADIMRRTKTTTKQEERIKTKNAKLAKLQQKEDRRKRATKGERRR